MNVCWISIYLNLDMKGEYENLSSMHINVLLMGYIHAAHNSSQACKWFILKSAAKSYIEVIDNY